MPSGQDWDAVNAGRGTGYTSAPKTAREITRMKAQGKLATERRYGDSAWRGGPPAPRPNPPPSGGRAGRVWGTAGRGGAAEAEGKGVAAGAAQNLFRTVPRLCRGRAADGQARVEVSGPRRRRGPRGLPSAWSFCSAPSLLALTPSLLPSSLSLPPLLSPPLLPRYGAGGNTSAHSATIMSTRKLEEADEAGKIAKVDKSLSKAIMQARTAKKMTQKDLATAINEKPQVIGQYESGKAIPNPQIISKLERKLGTKLPRPGKSKAPKAATAKAAGGATRGPPRAGARGTGPPKRR